MVRSMSPPVRPQRLYSGLRVLRQTRALRFSFYLPKQVDKDLGLLQPNTIPML